MLKRFFSVFLILLLILSAAAPAFAAGQMQQGSMYVNTSNGKALRFRSSKSTSANNILAEIPYGTKIYVTSWDGTWARIRYNSAVGYVVKKHLSIARPPEYSEVEAGRKQAEAEKKRQQELKAANNRLDHAKVKKVVPYDVTVLTDVKDLKAKVYNKASLLADVSAEYVQGVPLTVQARNKDWAQIYNPGTDFTGFMLLEDLVEDLVEEEDLDAE